ncbi:MFS transporter [Devriesea agamarum]|uniref:MFS transporter n=1 Tax=Devriesea agamarum TaxID=472569 RepID=UPI00155EBF72|nr:MFS transporter [Devriesea agamarum]
MSFKNRIRRWCYGGTVLRRHHSSARGDSSVPSATAGKAEARRVLGSLALPVYIPALIDSVGMTAITPVIPLMALQLGFSIPEAAALGLIAGIICILGPIPVGRAMTAFGERRSLVLAGLFIIAANIFGWILVSGADPNNADIKSRLGFIAVLIVVGAGGQVWMLGRQAYLGTALPAELRAQGMSMFGGMMRIGQIIGPLLGALVLHAGHLTWIFALDIVAMGIATVMVAFCMVPGGERAAARLAKTQAETTAQPEAALPAPQSKELACEQDNPSAVLSAPGAKNNPGRLSANRSELSDSSPHAPGKPALHTMFLVGVGITPLVMGRQNRPVILPLLGASLGLFPSAISLIFGVAAALEILMFIPAGKLMDRYGRTAVVVPCLAFMGAGYILMAILAWGPGHSSDHGAFIALMVSAVLIAFGNGFGAGVLMTLGVDVSPERHRTMHLARWNTILGVGRLAGPALVSGVTAVLTITFSAFATGILCLGGCVWLWKVIPKVTPSPKAGPFRRRDERE